MSLFGSIMGDFEDDPIFGSHMQSMQQMSSMMNSMFNPFGMMGQSQMMGLNGHAGQQQQLQLQHQQQHQQHLQLHQQQHNQMMPFGFPMAPFGMNDMFAGFNNMASAGGSHGMSSVSMMSYTSNGPDGRPQVYQASKTLRAAPGGIKETQETVYDSRSGTKKMAIGHHIGERGHVIEKQKNLHNGDEEEHQEYINLDEEEAEDFNKEWQTRTRQSSHSSHADRAIDYHQHHRKRSDPKRLALTDGTTSRSRLAPSTSRRNASKPSSSSSCTTYGVGDSSSPSTSDSDVVEVPHGEKRSKSPETSPVASRKRERNDDDETSNKRHMTANKDSDDNDNDDDDDKE